MGHLTTPASGSQNAAEMPQNFLHEPVMKKWAATAPLFRKPEKTTQGRHDNRIFVQDTWNHRKYP